MNSDSIATRLEVVRARIFKACQQSGRDVSTVQLVAVSKTKPLELIRSAIAADQLIFGENYVQEAVDKVNQMSTSREKVEWHFIGSLQSNKARAVAGNFALVHSVDRLKLAQALSSAAAARSVVQKILLQVHIGDEATKHGFSVDEFPEALAQIALLPGLKVCGLMSLPPLEESEAKARANFASLRLLLDSSRSSLAIEERDAFKELSMGTSADFDAAILEGATLVRVGTDIFGARA